MTTTEDLTDPISRKLNQFINVSIGLSLVIFVCSMIFLGSTSFWLSEAGFGLTMIHHGIILYKQNKTRTSGATARPGTLPASSTKFSIFAAWFIVLVWMAALGVVTMFTVFFFGGWTEGPWENRYIAVAFEFLCLVFETPLMVMIALWCARQRRHLLGTPENTK